jgi:hypothetical protein
MLIAIPWNSLPPVALTQRWFAVNSAIIVLLPISSLTDVPWTIYLTHIHDIPLTRMLTFQSKNGDRGYSAEVPERYGLSVGNFNRMPTHKLLPVFGPKNANGGRFSIAVIILHLQRGCIVSDGATRRNRIVMNTV